MNKTLFSKQKVVMSTSLLVLLLGVIVLLILVWMAADDPLTMQGAKILKAGDPPVSYLREIKGGWKTSSGINQDGVMDEYFPEVRPVPGDVSRSNSGSCIAGKRPSGPLPIVDIYSPLLKTST